MDPQRARWLVAQHRRFRILGTVRRIGYALAIAGLLLTIGSIVVAVKAPRLSPPWLWVFAPMYLVLFGCIAVCLRSFAEAMRRLDVIPTNAIPAELAATPRNVVITGLFGRFFRDLPLAFALMFVTMFLGMAYPDVREWSVLRARGVETQGVITEKRARDYGRGTVYSIVYRFDTPSGSRNGYETLSRAAYESVRQGDSTPVTYLPRSPVFNVPYRRADLTWRFFLRKEAPSPLLLLAFPMAFVLGVMMVRLRRKTTDFYQRGTATLATITEVGRQRLTYAYETEEGTKQGFILLRKKLIATPAAGEKIVVLYDPAKPQHSVAINALDDVRFEAVSGDFRRTAAAASGTG